MISPRLARRIASIHKWLGLIVAVQLIVWTGTGLFFASFHLVDVRGENLVRKLPPDMARAKHTLPEALKSVAEDRPTSVAMKSLAGEPVWEIRAEIGLFLVSAETLEVRSPIDEEMARKIATAAWAGQGGLARVELVEKPPRRESGHSAPVWVAHYEAPGDPVIYINTVNGDVGPVRTDLWRTYDFFYGLHLMDYTERENAHTPWTIALAALALSTVLFGVALLVNRFTRRRGIAPEKDG